MCEIHYNRARKHHGFTGKTRNSRGEGSVYQHGYKVLTIDGKRVYEHIYLAEKALGRKLPRRAVVHHMNEDRSDNHTPFNLVICPSTHYHKWLHHRMTTIKKED